MIKKLVQSSVIAFTITPISLIALSITSKSNAQELPPDQVIQSMYAGVANIHGYQAIPKVYRPIPPGFNTSRGPMVKLNAFYCRRDHSIYISIPMVRWAYQYGDAALAYVIGHEYAHAMQNVYKFNSNNGPISELQADCLAGFYMAAVQNLVFDNRDIAEVRSFAYALGDFSNVWTEHHGTPKQRVAAVTFGMRANSPVRCKL
jgi:hypothetical protein